MKIILKGDKMKIKNIFIFLILFFLNNTLFSQDNKFKIEDYKKIGRTEFVEIQKTNPKINIKSISENGNPFTKMEIDSLIKNSKFQNYIQILLKDTINNELLILTRKLNKEEINNQKAEYKTKLKAEKEFRKKLNGTIIDELSFEDNDGLKFNLNNLKGKVIVLNFWFTQCKPCVAEFPELNKLREKFKSKSVEFYAVTWNDKETVDKFLLNHKLDFNIIANGKPIIDKFKIRQYPFNILIDKKGKIHYINDVLVLNALKKLENKIDQALLD